MSKSPTKVAAGRIGGYATAARHDTREITAKARQTFQASFAAKADPDGVLSPSERARRAEAARNEFYARLSAAGAAARRNRSTPSARGTGYPRSANAVPAGAACGESTSPQGCKPRPTSGRSASAVALEAGIDGASTSPTPESDTARAATRTAS